MTTAQNQEGKVNLSDFLTKENEWSEMSPQSSVCYGSENRPPGGSAQSDEQSEAA